MTKTSDRLPSHRKVPPDLTLFGSTNRDTDSEGAAKCPIHALHQQIYIMISQERLDDLELQNILRVRMLNPTVSIPCMESGSVSEAPTPTGSEQERSLRTDLHDTATSGKEWRARLAHHSQASGSLFLIWRDAILAHSPRPVTQTRCSLTQVEAVIQCFWREGCRPRCIEA